MAEGPRADWLGEWDYAHRGLHASGVPENSPTAFADAIALGIGIELDVQCSRDGQAIVFHDREFDRLTADSGKVAKRDAVAIERIVLSGSADRIPSLRRTLNQIAEKVPVLIELKSALGRHRVPLCQGVQRALEGYRGRHAVMSFDPAIVRWFRRHSPQTIRGLVVEETGAKGPRGAMQRHMALWHAKPDFLAYNIGDLPSRFATARRRRGMPILTWTVRTSAQREAGMAHADALIAEFESGI